MNKIKVNVQTEQTGVFQKGDLYLYASEYCIVSEDAYGEKHLTQLSDGTLINLEEIDYDQATFVGRFIQFTISVS